MISKYSDKLISVSARTFSHTKSLQVDEHLGQTLDICPHWIVVTDFCHLLITSKQFGLRSGQTDYQVRSGSKLLDTLIEWYLISNT